MYLTGPSHLPHPPSPDLPSNLHSDIHLDVHDILNFLTPDGPTPATHPEAQEFHRRVQQRDA
ncbi:MAG: hypothetical protein JO362_18850 [Streptomycetaceae bacterium]|nr:hypothetical protein [Streptomycetaceae bacterium]